MLLKAILNPTVHPITAPSSATDDFKEPPVFVKELVDMEANDGDRVELVVKVEGQYPWRQGLRRSAENACCVW